MSDDANNKQISFPIQCTYIQYKFYTRVCSQLIITLRERFRDVNSNSTLATDGYEQRHRQDLYPWIIQSSIGLPRYNSRL